MAQIKKLEEYNKIKVASVPRENSKVRTKKNLEETLLILTPKRTKDEAIERKLDSLRVKILGFTLGKFEIGEMRDVYVPYSLITYSFLIDRKTLLNRNGALNKSGEISYVFDYNEVHPFQYDSVENGS